MVALSQAPCPKCGLTLAENGVCHHCQSESLATRTTSEPISSGGLLWIFWELVALGGILVLVLLVCLMELGAFINRARWFGIVDYTFVYLVGSILVGLVDILGAALLLKRQGRWTRFTWWLAGTTFVWIPVSGGIALGLLPNSLPKWLPISYVGFFCLPLPLALWFHRDFLKRVLFGKTEVTPDQIPVDSKWGIAIGGTFHVAFTGACCVLLITLAVAGRRVDSALDALVADLDKAEELLNEAERMPLEQADTTLITELHQKVRDRASLLADESLSQSRMDKLAAIFARSIGQLTRTRELLARSQAKLATQRKSGVK